LLVSDQPMQERPAMGRLGWLGIVGWSGRVLVGGIKAMEEKTSA